MLKFFFIFSLFLVSVHGDITLQEIQSKPTSRAKDFMVWQYFKQDITPAQADEAFSQLSKVNNKLLLAYANKTDKPEINETLSCMKRNDLLSIEKPECLALAMSPYKTLAMTQKQREELSQKIDSQNIKDLLRIQNEPYEQKAYESYDAETILTMFTSTTVSHRRENLNIDLDEQFVNKLTTHPKVFSFIKTVFNDDKLDKLQKSLSVIDAKMLNAESNFWIALHHIKSANKKEALKYLEFSVLNATQMIDVDKGYFWMYLISKDEKYLHELLLSKDINIYTLYAHEILKKDFDNYFTSVETLQDATEQNLQDPFDWLEILNKINETPKEELITLASQYKFQNMSPVQAFILEKANDYKMHSFIMPYDEYLQNLSNDEKALVYAIMKQESHLIPSAISHSYALGLMQLMPFVADAISIKEKEPMQSYAEMFNPKNNINYALKHINWMKKLLYHPLFMAYAYNGGMGFFKKFLLNGNFNEGLYEPFMSMERMQNSESREYGKKVLAYYVMYKKIMGENVSIVHLFEILTQPKETDSFREQAQAL